MFINVCLDSVFYRNFGNSWVLSKECPGPNDKVNHLPLLSAEVNNGRTSTTVPLFTFMPGFRHRDNFFLQNHETILVEKVGVASHPIIRNHEVKGKKGKVVPLRSIEAHLGDRR
jgi:hypothetical protein